MDTFFIGVAPDKALDLAGMSRRAFELREQRKALLDASGFDTPDALLEAVREGQVEADTAYDTWLSLALLHEQHEALRTWIDWRCRESAEHDEPCDSPVAAMLEAQPLPEPFASSLTVHPDAISCSSGDVSVIARIVSATHWSLQWGVGDRIWRLDTAPRGAEAITTRACLRRPDGSRLADPWGFDGMDARERILPHLLSRLATTPEP